MKRGLPLIPILLGAAAGGLVAVLQSPKPSRPAPEAVPASAHAAVAPSSSPPASPPSPSPTPERAPSAETSSAIGAAAALPAPSASANDAAVSPPPGASKSVFDLTEPATETALLDAQIACNRSVPDACERAARALESGAASTKDPARARALKRIALTLYVKQCEGSRPAACARLAEMYEVGELVQKNEKSVQGLRARVAELCRAKPNQLGCPTGS